MKTLFIAVVAALSFSVHAQVTTAAPGFDGFMSLVTGAGRQTVSYGSGGQALVAPGVPQLTAGTNISVSQAGSIATTNGRVAVQVAGAIPKAQIAASMGKFLGRALPGVGTALAVLELARELGFTANLKADQTLELSKSTDKLQVSASCNGFIYSGSPDEVATQCTLRAGQVQFYCPTIPITYQLTADGLGFKYFDCPDARGNGVTWQTKAVVGGPVTPATAQDLADAIANKSGWPPTSKVAEVVSEAQTQLAPSEKMKPSPTTVTGPSTSGEPRVTSVDKPMPTGGTEKTTKTCTDTNAYVLDEITTTERCTEVVMAPDGTTKTGVITTAPDAKKPVDKQITCGLPDTPACKIDETGMPTGGDVDSKMNKKPSDIQKDIDDIVKNPKNFFPPFPALNWAFTLPTGCAVIPLPAFAPMLTGIDICQFKPMFHDIMGLVWTLGGLFGAISLFMKNTLSS